MRNRSLMSFALARPALIVLFVLLPIRLLAQFDSGSTGINGPFPASIVGGTTEIVLNLQDGTLIFNPSGVGGFLPNVPEGGLVDGVLEFTTFDLPEGITLRFSPAPGNPAVTILAQGDVNVMGTIDVSGQAGSGSGFSRTAFGGPGGFSGGLEKIGSNAEDQPGAGLGPGGGGAKGRYGGGGGHGLRGVNASAVDGGSGGPAYGTNLLRPLIGGSGGGGGSASTGSVGPGGGGGGGAIGIASSTKIVVDGSILARGGAGGEVGLQYGGGGAGGAIRLTANAIRGTGLLSTLGGASSASVGGGGSVGRIRIEAFDNSFAGGFEGVLTHGAPGPVKFDNPPRIHVTAVDGQPVPASPNGALRGMDLKIDSPGTRTIEITTNNVPISTTVSIVAKPENGRSGVTVIGPATNQVAGTFEAATATVDLDFPLPGLYFIEAQTVVEP